MNRKVLKYVILSAAVSCLSLITLSPFFDRFENQIYDLRFRQKYPATEEMKGSIRDVVIVDIDQKSIDKLGKYYEWPRSYFANVVDNLSSKPSLIAFDMVFDRSRYSDQDSILAESFRNSGRIVTGYSFAYEDPDNFIYADSVDNKLPNAVCFENDLDFNTEEFFVMNEGSENIVSTSELTGFLNVDSDNGVIRKVQLIKKYKGRYYCSFALAMCVKILDIDYNSIKLNDGKSIVMSRPDGGEIIIPLDSENNLLINYKGYWATYLTVSFYDVMAGRISGNKTFKNKPVLIGASYHALNDIKGTPMGQLPGVEVHANIIHTILNQDFILTSGRNVTFLLMLIAIIFTAAIIFSRLNILVSTSMIMIIGFFYYKVTGKMFFDNNRVLDTTRPLLALFFTFLTSYTIRYYIENRSKKFIKATLGKYVPEIVSKELLKNPEKFKLGGEKKEITMMFSDIRNFTSYSERTDPKQLVEFLNIYLKRMTGVIKKNCGTLDKYMGDAVICFFGAPVDNDHPYNCCKSALEMMNELKLLKSELKEDTFKNIDIGIGVNTDVVTVGNIGSDDLFDYTAIGDGMNLASRLEGLNKYYGTHILTSGNTYEKVKDRFVFRELDDVSVKGKDRSVRMYELLGETGDRIDEKILKKAEKYSEALKIYRKGDFKAAYAIFKEIVSEFDDKSSEVMRERCELMIKEPPADWKGVWKMDSK